MSQDFLENVREVVDASKEKGTFNILSALKDRAYPKDEVIVYLDEDVAYRAAQAQEKVNVAGLGAKKNDTAEIIAKREAELEKLEAERDEIIKELTKSRYVFKLRGISEGRREEIYNLSSEAFPVEYREERNQFSGELIREEIPNADRDRIYTNNLWASHIEAIVSPDGETQQGISVEDVEPLRNNLPLAARAAINECIEKLRLATATFMFEVDEDFLAKS